MITYQDKNYELKYNMKRLELIERVTDMPTLADIKRTGGMLSISSLKAYLAYGLKEEGADAFVPAGKAMEMAENMIQDIGYIDTCGIVLEALDRDCPFLFPAD